MRSSVRLRRATMRRTSRSSPSTSANCSPECVSTHAQALPFSAATCTPAIWLAGRRRRRERSSRPSNLHASSSARTNCATNASASAAVAAPTSRKPASRSNVPQPMAAAASSAENRRAPRRLRRRKPGPSASVRSRWKMPRTPRRLDQRRQQFHRMRRLGYPEGNAMEQAGCQVLVVDDDADTRDALVAALESDQFCVEQVSSGAAALERCGHLPAVDVVLLDLHMPGMKGTDVLEQLKTMPGSC